MARNKVDHLLVEEFKIGGYSVEIRIDDDAQSYEDSGDHFGHIVYRKSSSYTLGDTPMNNDEVEALLYLPNIDYEDDDEWNDAHDEYRLADDESPEEAAAYARQERREIEINALNDQKRPAPDLVVLPVSAYVHSGATIWVGRPGQGPTGTDCRWDSAQSGFVYCTYAEWRDMNCKPADHVLTEEDLTLAKEQLTSSVKEFDDHLCGRIYGYVIKDDCGETVDSCWSYVGESKYCRDVAEGAAKALPVLEGKRERYVALAARIAEESKERAAGTNKPQVRVDADPKVERVTGTRQAWVTCEVLIDLDQFPNEEEEEE